MVSIMAPGGSLNNPEYGCDSSMMMKIALATAIAPSASAVTTVALTGDTSP